MKALFSSQKTKPETRKNPYANANFLSKILFSWMSELISVSNNTTWLQEHNYDLAFEEKVQCYKKGLEETFQRKKSLIPALISYFPGRFFLMFLMSVISSSLRFGSTLITTKFFTELKLNKDITDFKNIQPLALWLFSSGLITLLGDVLGVYFDFVAAKLSQVIKATMLATIQDKICNFSTMNSSKFTEGFLTNLVQVDAVQLEEMVGYLYKVLSTVIGIIIATGGMIFYVGWKMALIIEGSYILFSLASLFIYKGKKYVTENYLKAKDKRMTLFRNVLENVDFIKIKGQENFYSRELYELRENELGYLKQNSAVEGALVMITWFAFSMTSVVMMLIYSFVNKNPVESFATFTGMSDSLNNLRGYLADLVVVWNFFTGFSVNIERINSFLNAKEIDRNHVQFKNDKESNIAISVKNGNFKWRYSEKEEGTEEKMLSKEPELNSSIESLPRSTISDGLFVDEENDKIQEDSRNTFFLREIDLSISKGEKIAIIGKSTSGKSSLLYSLLGEMIPIDSMGHVDVIINGKIAYMSQQRWIIGDTIKENIVLGSEYDEDLMQKSLEASQFLVDLLTLDHGLETVLSDSGDSVSGGQRARIALARCFYQK